MAPCRTKVADLFDLARHQLGGFLSHGGSPKSSHYQRISHEKNHPTNYWGTPSILGNIHFKTGFQCYAMLCKLVPDEFCTWTTSKVHRVTSPWLPGRIKPLLLWQWATPVLASQCSIRVSTSAIYLGSSLWFSRPSILVLLIPIICRDFLV